MNRPLAAVEFVLAAGVVLAHNVWRVVPNEVLILTALAHQSIRAHRKPAPSIPPSKPTGAR